MGSEWQAGGLGLLASVCHSKVDFLSIEMDTPTVGLMGWAVHLAHHSGSATPNINLIEIHSKAICPT